VSLVTFIRKHKTPTGLTVGVISPARGGAVWANPIALFAYCRLCTPSSAGQPAAARNGRNQHPNTQPDRRRRERSPWDQRGKPGSNGNRPTTAQRQLGHASTAPSRRLPTGLGQAVYPPRRVRPVSACKKKLPAIITRRVRGVHKFLVCERAQRASAPFRRSPWRLLLTGVVPHALLARRTAGEIRSAALASALNTRRAAKRLARFHPRTRPVCDGSLRRAAEAPEGRGHAEDTWWTSRRRGVRAPLGCGICYIASIAPCFAFLCRARCIGRAKTRLHWGHERAPTPSPARSSI
jgi:hypothetical protein